MNQQLKLNDPGYLSNPLKNCFKRAKIKLWDSYIERCKNKLKKIDETLIKNIVKCITNVIQPEKIILFGSYAKGEANEKSDIDILIIQPSDLPRYKRSKPVRLALKGLFPSKDIVIYTPEEVKDWETASTSFIASVLREGRVLYERQ